MSLPIDILYHLYYNLLNDRKSARSQFYRLYLNKGEDRMANPFVRCSQISLRVAVCLWQDLQGYPFKGDGFGVLHYLVCEELNKRGAAVVSHFPDQDWEQARQMCLEVQADYRILGDVNQSMSERPVNGTYRANWRIYVCFYDSCGQRLGSYEAELLGLRPGPGAISAYARFRSRMAPKIVRALTRVMKSP